MRILRDTGGFIQRDPSLEKILVEQDAACECPVCDFPISGNLSYTCGENSNSGGYTGSIDYDSDVGTYTQYFGGANTFVVIEMSLYCVREVGIESETGWYLRIFFGTGDGCSFSTNPDGDQYVKITDCPSGPEGFYSFTLTDPGPTGGTADIDVTIDPCPEPTGACCSSYGVCDDDVTEAGCAGTWYGQDTTCMDDVTGACCLGGSCFDVPEFVCTSILGGTFLGQCTDCDHESC